MYAYHDIVLVLHQGLYGGLTQPAGQYAVVGTWRSSPL